MKRTKRLEKYLENNITLSFCHPDPDLMDIIDNTSTPETFVEFFFEVSNGDFPSDQDGYSEPVTQEAFFLMFYNKFRSQNADKFTDKYRKCWKRRCQVTYPSLIRDMHFVYLLNDFNDREDIFDDIQYDPELDVKEGADAVIEKDDVVYYINLYVNTDKSKAYLDKKKSYRHPDHNCKEIHLPIDRNDEKNKNIELKDGSDLWLYSEDHIEKIIEQII